MIKLPETAPEPNAGDSSAKKTKTISSLNKQVNKDDSIDGWAATLIIILITAGVCYFLQII